MAEAVLRRELAARGAHGWRVDSAGTSHAHAGELADPDARRELARRGLHTEHRSRPVAADDFDNFDVIWAMDEANLHWLRARCPPHARAKLALLRDATGGGDVPDPWGEPGAFGPCFDLIDDAVRAWLDRWQSA